MLQYFHSNTTDRAGSSLAVDYTDIRALYIIHYLTCSNAGGLIGTAEHAIYCQHNNFFAFLSKLGEKLHYNADRRLRSNRQFASCVYHTEQFCQRAFPVLPFQISVTDNQTQNVATLIILQSCFVCCRNTIYDNMYFIVHISLLLIMNILYISYIRSSPILYYIVPYSENYCYIDYS